MNQRGVPGGRQSLIGSYSPPVFAICSCFFLTTSAPAGVSCAVSISGTLQVRIEKRRLPGVGNQPQACSSAPR